MNFIKPTLLLLPLLLFLGCEGKKKEQPPLSFPISETSVIKKDALIYVDTIGHVTSPANINVKSRVEGELQEVYFEDGTEVKENTILFTIDPRPYQAQLEQSQATLAENMANLRQAQDRLNRYTALLADEYVSELDFDQMRTNVAQYDAIVKQNEAEVKIAQINLDYCEIRSPVTGLTGIVQFDKGNLIKPDDENPIVIINQMSPIFVEFTIAEKHLPKIRFYQQQQPLAVRASYDDIEKNFVEGKLQVIDNKVDMTTGMITMRALYENKDYRLWPGQFVKTRVILTVMKDALLVPNQAVQITTEGPIVYVVKEDNTIDMRHVELGQRENENIIVTKGLKENETIVLEGQLNLYAGAHVYIPEQYKKSVQ